MYNGITIHGIHFQKHKHFNARDIIIKKPMIQNTTIATNNIKHTIVNNKGTKINIKFNTQSKKSQFIGLLKILYIVIKFIKILIGLKPIYYNFSNL